MFFFQVDEGGAEPDRPEPPTQREVTQPADLQPRGHADHQGGSRE